VPLVGAFVGGFVGDLVGGDVGTGAFVGDVGLVGGVEG